MEIKIYIIPTCRWCAKLKEWFKKNKHSYQEHDLTESDSARDEIIQKSFSDWSRRDLFPFSAHPIHFRTVVRVARPCGSGSRICPAG